MARTEQCTPHGSNLVTTTGELLLASCSRQSGDELVVQETFSDRDNSGKSLDASR